MPVYRAQEGLVTELQASFAGRFGRPPTFAVRAPGRVNLIGEHTDYNDGLVLPFAIDRHTVVVGALRDDRWIRIHSREASVDDTPSEFQLHAPLLPAGDWLDYVRGAVTVVEAFSGQTVPGLDLAVASDVPAESGLSSSAAFGVGLVTALERAIGLRLAPEERGRLAHGSESGFVGVPCGIMDQYASALGRRDHALRIDCRSLEAERVPLPGQALGILVANSGVQRRLAAGGYGDRRSECQAALAAAAEVLERTARPRPESLRDLATADLPLLADALDPLLYRRLRHVVTENDRVEAFCEALAGADYASTGRLLREGMASLRDDFEVSIPELDTLCSIGDATSGVHGSRLTGAGFGGCTIHLVEKSKASEAAEQIAAGFEKRFSRRPAIFEVTPADGAEILT